MRSFEMISKGEQYILACFILFIEITCQTQKTYYTAAVVEYHPVQNGADALQTAGKNADMYCSIIADATADKVDIIVFPENGLSSQSGNQTELLSAATAVPNPRDSVVPCHSTDNYLDYFRKLSCAAAEKKMYVVINVHEKKECSKPDTCEPKLYNTNVVFDRSGTVVARYRKYNLFGSESTENGISSPLQPELSIFTTDFNVTFAQLIGSDILYQSPALTLIKERKITDIVYSARWFSERPFLTSLQYQYGLSCANDVNFLGSGLGDPDATSSGSGIFAGPEILNLLWHNDFRNILKIANVSKVLENGTRYPPVDCRSSSYGFATVEESTFQKRSWLGYSIENLTAYTTEIYNTDRTAPYSTSLCNNGLCCEFNISSYVECHQYDEDDYCLSYRLVVFKGVRYYGTAAAGVEVCGVIACLNDDLDSCGHYPETATRRFTVFTSIDITRSVENGSEGSKLYTPSLMSSNGLLEDSGDFVFTVDEILDKSSLSLKTEQDNLMTFAIYGRDFKRDGSGETKASNQATTRDLNDAATTSSNDAASTDSIDAATTGSEDTTTGSNDVTTTGLNEVATKVLSDVTTGLNDASRTGLRDATTSSNDVATTGSNDATTSLNDATTGSNDAITGSNNATTGSNNVETTGFNNAPTSGLINAGTTDLNRAATTDSNDAATKGSNDATTGLSDATTDPNDATSGSNDAATTGSNFAATAGLNDATTGLNDATSSSNDATTGLSDATTGSNDATTSSNDATTGSNDVATTGPNDATTGSSEAITGSNNAGTTGLNDATTPVSGNAATNFLTHEIFITMLFILFVRTILY